MTKLEVTIIDTGIANIASVQAWLAREDVNIQFAKTADQIIDTPAIILPGVGAFAAGIQALEKFGFKDALIQRAAQGKATLAICLGMQMFCSASEESPGIAGLNIIPGAIKKFPNDVVVPHFGWNSVESEIPNIKSADAYFANSYFLDVAPNGWQACWTDYGTRFISALKRGKIILTQFHPELSAEFGKQILQNWIMESLC